MWSRYTALVFALLISRSYGFHDGVVTYIDSVLCNNQFYGSIPNDIGGLTMLEVLDLRNNNLSGTIPAELGGLRSLKRL